MELRFWLKLMFLIQIAQDLLDSGVHSMESTIKCHNPHHYLYTNDTTHDRWCCQKCRSGTEVQQHCKPGQPNSTKCKACPQGQYQPLANGEQFCRICDVQHKANRKLLSNCTATRNKKYGPCKEGFYYNGALDSCQKCKRCAPGIGVEEQCTNSSNTICLRTKCQPGTYSDKNSYSQKCQNCAACAAHEEMHRECSPTSNYGCRLKRITTTPSKPLATTRPTTRVNDLVKGNNPNDSQSRNTDSSSNSRGWVMPFFVSAMALLLFMFLVFVIGVGIWCHRHSRKKQERNVTVECPMIENSKNISFEDTNSSMVTRDSDGYQIVIPRKVCENGMMLRDVSHDVIEKLASYLNPGSANNWKKLATHLGFSWDYIRNLELNPTTVTQKLLEGWVTKKEATVYALYTVLKKIDRDDAADILGRVLTDPYSYQSKVV